MTDICPHCGEYRLEEDGRDGKRRMIFECDDCGEVVATDDVTYTNDG